MRTLACLSFALLPLLVSAQQISVSDSITRFGITEKGIPAGEMANSRIGEEGSTLLSSDGKVELIFPAGAVQKKTVISIQPVTNLAPNGNGYAYEMKPSGIHLQKPVRIIFHYSNEETEGSLSTLLNMATQDEEGHWSPLKEVEIDTINHTVSASISHFSYYAIYGKVKLRPSSARVRVNETVRLIMTSIFEYNGDESLEETSLLGTKLSGPPAWSANAVPGGNAAVGTVSASVAFSSLYKAPARVPHQNPVAVTAEIKGSTGVIDGKSFNNLKLVSNITVYDKAWEVKLESTMKGGSKQAWGGLITYADAGSFLFSMEKAEPAVLNVKNHLEKMTNNCTKLVLNPTTCTGLIHISTVRSIKVTPANPPSEPFPRVEIWFVPFPVEITKYRFTCPPPPGVKESANGTIDESTTARGMPSPMFMLSHMPSLPSYLKFIAKEGEQVIGQMGEPGSEVYYKMSVNMVK
ncbi:MAG TPA: hypothetical protein VK644_06030 [Chitinophagaceae bacterium]|nr:hypothetical protein [Chitinophagaceae bacterium]